MSLNPHRGDRPLRFAWRWNGKLLVFIAMAMSVTVSAGFWQLRRAEEKHELLATFAARAEAQPVALELVDVEADNRYLRVLVSGTPDRRREFLLDNRMRDGRAGYEVLTPVRYAGRGWVLVNRGWLPRTANRALLPQIPSLDDEPVVLTGYLYRSPGNPVVLGPEEPASGWPQVIQQPDQQLLEQRLGTPLFPYQVRLEDSPGLVTGWVTTNLSPEQHRGYAVQWFALSMALVVLGVVSNSNLPELWRARGRQRSE